MSAFRRRRYYHVWPEPPGVYYRTREDGSRIRHGARAFDDWDRAKHYAESLWLASADSPSPGSGPTSVTITNAGGITLATYGPIGWKERP